MSRLRRPATTPDPQPMPAVACTTNVSPQAVTPRAALCPLVAPGSSLRRHEILHAPHAHKNHFILAGYRLHDTPRAALADVFSLHNETFNVITALAAWIVTAYMLHCAFEPAAAVLHPTHRHFFLRHALGCALNGTLVAAYHVFNTHPAWYHFMSAVDLGAISATALLFLGGFVWEPGMSAFATGLREMEAGGVAAAAARPWLHTIHQALKMEGRHLHAIGLLPPDATSQHVWYVLVLTFTAVCGTVAVVRRVQIARESPKWLLSLNFLPHAYFAIDHTVASPNADSYLACVLIIGGAFMYGLKLPERIMHYWHGHPELANKHPASGRLIDLFGHSHMVWHIMYTLAFYLTGRDVVSCAWRYPALSPFAS